MVLGDIIHPANHLNTITPGGATVVHHTPGKMGRFFRKAEHGSQQRPYIIETMHSYTLPM